MILFAILSLYVFFQVSFPFLTAAGSSLSTSGSLDTEGSYDEDRPLSVRLRLCDNLRLYTLIP